MDADVALHKHGSCKIKYLKTNCVTHYTDPLLVFYGMNFALPAKLKKTDIF